MARLNEQEVLNAVQPHLEPGEQVRHWAIGYQQPMWLLVLGALAAALFTKFYVVGMTDRRLLILRYKGRLKIQEITEYRIGQIPPIQTKTGPVNTLLTLHGPQKVLYKFHRNAMKNNRPQALDLVAAIQQTGSFQQPPAAVYQAPPPLPRQAAPQQPMTPPPLPQPLPQPVPQQQRQTPPPLPLQARSNGFALRLGSRRFSLSAEAKLREEDIAGLLAQTPDGIVAVVDRNPNDPSVLGLKNLSTSPWSATLPGGEKHDVAAGRTIKLIGGTRIDFGFCNGVIEN